MGPVTATRAGRSLLARTTILTLALVIAAPAGSAAASSLPLARGAGACDGHAALGVSNRRPSQSRPVRFDATGSTVPTTSIAFYDFAYGDGSDDAGSQPTAVHAYQEPGTYVVELSIVTVCGTVVTSPSARIVVLDGVPPSAVIDFPRANQVAHFGRAGLLLSGSAGDPSGVRRVELAIQLLSLKRAGVRSGTAQTAAEHTTQSGCYWYDGKVTLRLRPCSTPLYFAAHYNAGRWSFRMNPRSRIPPGVYAVRVRATDGAANTNKIFSPRLGNILGFSLVA